MRKSHGTCDGAGDGTSCDWLTNRILLVVLLVLSVPLAFVRADDFVPYPLKNGGFTMSQRPGQLSGWARAIENGRHEFGVDPPVPQGSPQTPHMLTAAPAAAVIRTREIGRCYYFQSVSLLEGRHRIRVEVAGAAGGKAQLSTDLGNGWGYSPVAVVTEEFQELSIEVDSPGGDALVYLTADSPTDGVVKFLRPTVQVVRLNGSPLMLDDGTVLAAIVLPEQPTPAESYAAYELQRLLRRITGKTVGIQGRDQTPEGGLVFLGRAATNQQAVLRGLPTDSFVVHHAPGALALAGNSDLGTLYAVYDFLARQGCQWLYPGSGGETIPQRETLIAAKSKVESPDYRLVRGFLANEAVFDAGGGWIYHDVDACIDWAIRNRLNAVWTGGQTLDFGAHRGHGWVQDSGHSFNATIAPHEKHFATHPDWYPLVRGRRMPVADIGPKLPNQLCVSNRGLRDYTVDLVVDHFRRNPHSGVFPMNPMDGPNYNCECDDCRALDPPGYAWNQDFTGPNYPSFPHLKLPPMADRYLSYINYVAERLQATHPNKLLELYTYANREPPIREKVHPNVLIKFCWLSGRAMNVGLMDPHDPLARKERQWLEGWKQAGTRNLTYYNYTDWENPNAGLYWYFNIADQVRHLHREYDCIGLLGETHTQVQADPVWYAVLARTLWDVDTPYRDVIRATCGPAYGPAADEMTAFYLLMDESLLRSSAGQEPDYHPNLHREIGLEDLERGRAILERAAAKVESDPVLTRRVALSRFAHAVKTYASALNLPKKTPRSAQVAREAFDLATALRSQHGLMVGRATSGRLAEFRYPEIENAD